MELFDLIERESVDKLLAIMAETMKEIDKMSLGTKAYFINSAREMIHEISRQCRILKIAPLDR